MDRRTLNLVAAILCGVGSLAALLPLMFSRGARSAAGRGAMLSALMGTIGSAAWAASAYEDHAEAVAEAAPA